MSEEQTAFPSPPDAWERLDPKTLLTGPVTATRQFGIPVAIAVIGLGSSGGLSGALIVFGIAVVAISVLGAIPWLTTSYRITSTHLEVRSGLLNRKTLTARLDRVRSVDLEAPLIHQALGIVQVKVGTGVDDGQIELDSLPRTAAEQLRTRLLHGARTSADADAAAGVTPDRPAPGVELAALEWSWLRYAPLNLLNAAIVVGSIVAVVSQLGDVVGAVAESDAADAVSHLGVLVAVIALAVGALVLWVPLSCLGYALRWFNLRITREQGKDGTTLHQSAGLLTTRSTTVEEAKVRGVRMRRQVLIAAAGGAELSLLTIGLEDNTPAILPAAPMPAVARIGHEVLGEDAPLTVPAVRHGRVVLWRYLRVALWKTLALVAAAIAWTILADAIDVDWPAWASVLIVAAFAALWFTAAGLRYRNLGHALTRDYLVAQSGAITRDRIALETDGIVGWRLHQSYFDRRLGLVQLTATTAAGDESVLVRDLPLADAVALTRAATPHIVSEFVTA